MERRLAISGGDAVVAVPERVVAVETAPVRTKQSEPKQPAAKEPEPPAAEEQASETQPPAPEQPESERVDTAAVVAASGIDLHEVRRLWPSVLDRVKTYRRVTWAQLFEKSEVKDIDAKQLTIGTQRSRCPSRVLAGGSRRDRPAGTYRRRRARRDGDRDSRSLCFGGQHQDECAR